MPEIRLPPELDRTPHRSPTNWRLKRGRKLALRLRRSVEALALLRGGVEVGPDILLEDIAARLGLSNDAVALRQYAFGAQPVTVVAPTHRTWHRPHLRRRLDALATQATRGGRTIAIWPPDEVLLEPRLSNAIAIAAAMKAPAFGDAERLEALLAGEDDPVPLDRCSRALPGRFATERLYGLLTCSRFELVHDRPLGPDIGMRLRAAGGLPGDPTEAPSP